MTMCLNYRQIFRVVKYNCNAKIQLYCIMKFNNVVIGFCIILILVEIVPYFITILFPNLCYGCTSTGKLHQHLNTILKFSYFAWIAYVFLFCYLIYNSLFFKNPALKYFVICVCLFMIYFPTLPLINIITFMLCLIYKNPPFVVNHGKEFPGSIQIEQNSDEIIKEFKSYNNKNKSECIRTNNPGFIIENNSIAENCWRSLYLKKTGKFDNNMIKYFPNTIKLLQDKQIHNAFFSILDPGVEIPPHIGYYKGYLRYHMGVVIPNNDSGRTDDKAYIVCGGKKYIWKKGAGVLFDDMYLHYVKNPTNQMRVVLYLDIKRKSESWFVNKINDIGIYLLEHSILLNRFLKNQHSQNKIENLL